MNKNINVVLDVHTSEGKERVEGTISSVLDKDYFQVEYKRANKVHKVNRHKKHLEGM